MTLAEFKAWFEGFSETMGGPPNEKQWDRIKTRVAEISDTPISYPIFLDRYVAPYRRYYDGPTWVAGNTAPFGESIEDSFTTNRYGELKRAARAEYASCL